MLNLRYCDVKPVPRCIADSVYSVLCVFYRVQERNLLSVAYKNVVGTRRSSWRVISSIDQKEDDEKKKKIAQDYLKVIADEIKNTCTEVVVSTVVSFKFVALKSILYLFFVFSSKRHIYPPITRERSKRYNELA